MPRITLKIPPFAIQSLQGPSLGSCAWWLIDRAGARSPNTLNAEHLPPKLVQVVCCNLTDIQKNMYQHLISSKDMQHVLDGKQVNCLSSIQMLMKFCNHPRLVAEEDAHGNGNGNIRSGGGRRAAAAGRKSYAEQEEKSSVAPSADGVARYLPMDAGEGGGGGEGRGVHR